MKAFISYNRPLFSRRKILDFAQQLGIHPGILVGQLQYRGEILYSHSRDLLVPVRDAYRCVGTDRRLEEIEKECVMYAKHTHRFVDFWLCFYRVVQECRPGPTDLR